MGHKLARIVAVICLTLTMILPFVISGSVLADSPDNCWRVIGTYNPPTVTEYEGEYMLSDSPFRYDGVNYIFTPVYYMSGAMEYLGEGVIYPLIMGEPIPLDGTQDIDVAVYSFLYVGDPPLTFHATVYYPNGNKSDVDAFWEELSGEGNWSCDAYFEGVFVNESGAYTYHAPTPACVPEPTPTFAPEDTIEEIMIPDFNESSPWIWSATTMNQTDAEGDLCDIWESIWDEGMLMPAIPPYNIVASASMTGTTMIARNLLAFNTSDIPDDAIITGAYLRIVPYMWAQMFNLENTGVRIGGTHNASIFPMEYLGGETPLPVGNYSESEFYGNFGRFDFVDMPITMMTFNFNQSVYYDVWLNDSGVEYINPEGLTVLTLRVEEDADFSCPQSEMNMTMSELGVWGGNLSGEEPAPHSMLVVGWHSPSEEEEPIIPTGPVSALLIIVGLVFTVLGLFGIMAVLFKGESLILSVKIGVLVGLSIFAIIGIMIMESIIVALTGG